MVKLGRGSLHYRFHRGFGISEDRGQDATHMYMIHEALCRDVNPWVPTMVWLGVAVVAVILVIAFLRRFR